MVKIWRYYLPPIENEGWAEIVLCSSGMFAAVSDYGNYAHAWRDTLGGIRAFFAARDTADVSYFGAKLAHGRRVYDSDATVENVCKWLDAQHAEGVIDEEQLAEHKENIGNLFNGLSEREDFRDWYRRVGGIHDAVDWYEAAQLCADNLPSSVVAFCEKVLPRLAVAIRKELEEEKLQTQASA